MKKIIISILLTFTCTIFAQDRIIYIQKEDINMKQLAEWQKNDQIIDQFTTHTDVSLMQKIENIRQNWSREAMDDLLKDFSISPEQFGVVIDSLANVVIRQSNDIPNTAVGRIALAGFAWKIAGPTIFKFLFDIGFIIFFLIFFTWSYKKNFWSTVFVVRKEDKLFGKVLEKEKIEPNKLFNEDSWMSTGDGSFDNDTSASKTMHLIALGIFIAMSIFIL